MAEKKQKRESNSFIELENEEAGYVLKPVQVEVGSGYTVSATYEDEKQVVDVKTYGKVDVSKLRREIEKAFPNAQIRQLSQTGPVTVVAKRRVKRK